MANYIDLVLVKDEQNDLVLCTAPAWTYFDENDEVQYTLDDGKLVNANVIKSATIDSDSDIFKLIEEYTFSPLKKIMKKVKYENVYWRENNE